MKKFYILTIIMLFALSINSNAQDGIDKKHSPKNIIPFGKKLPQPGITEDAEESVAADNKFKHT